MPTAPQLIDREQKFDRHDRVVANIDLHGVPIGTPGKVIAVSGLTWMRYHVLFENGVSRGSLDSRHIVKPEDFVPLDERVEEIAAAPEGPVADGGDGAAADASGDRGGVPAHLLERSKKARERLAAAG
jgi:hypothetical protein